MKTKEVQLEWPMGRSIMAKDGSEVPDPRPMALPVGFERPESVQDMIRRLVRDQSLQADLEASGVETFEDADDFDVPDDMVPPFSPHEEDFDPTHGLTRELEIKAGVVPEPTPAEKKAAADLLKANQDPSVLKTKNTAVVVPVDKSPKSEEPADK